MSEDLLAEVRDAAAERAAELGLPTSKHEAWRYVACDPLQRVPSGNGAARPTVDAATVERYRPADSAGRLLVLVDGRLDAELSDTTAMPGGVSHDRIAHMPTAEAVSLTGRWQHELAEHDDITECWSFTDLVDGIACYARGINDETVVILSFSTGGAHAWRLAIDCTFDTSLGLALLHVELAPSRCSVGIDVAAGMGASVRIDEVHLADHAQPGQFFAHRRLDCQRSARIAWRCALNGGELLRITTDGNCYDRDAHIELGGVAVVADGHQAHHYLRLSHHEGGSTSRQLFKNVLADGARTSFDGLVHIAQGADGTDAQQHNHNLVLGERARADARPQLDVKADDVSAAHGATVGRPDADEIRYLRSRGLDLADALRLRTWGFADEVVAGFHHAGMRDIARERVLASLRLEEEEG